MTDVHGKTIAEIASDPKVQVAVRRLDRLRDAQRAVSEASTKLMIAEQALLTIQREIESDRGVLK